MSIRALIIDDSPKSVESLEMKVRSLNHEVVSVNDQCSAYSILEKQTFDYALVDIHLKIDERDMDPDEEVGFATIRYIREHYPTMKIIAVTAYDEQHETTLRATQSGADNFWSKNPNRNLEKLQNKIIRLLQESGADFRGNGSLAESDKSIREASKSKEHASTSMEQVEELVARLAPLDVTILLVGEPGTGKEFYARKIKELSARRDKPFDAINCANLTANLLKSELFGHGKGAFTGAIKDRLGTARSVDSGTLFMDEISAIPVDCQKQILRFIELKEIKPEGADRTERVDVRIIAATNIDLKTAVGRGEFPADLYDRLSGYVIEIPPLRDRGHSEILRLAQLFYQAYRQEHRTKSGRTDIRVARGALEELSRLNYNWPGNIRELKQLIERTMNVKRGRRIGIKDFVGQMEEAVRESIKVGVHGESQVVKCNLQTGRTVELTEREEIVLSLIRENGSVTRKQVQEALGFKTTVTWDLLNGMIEKRLIQPEGSGRNVRYILS